MPSFDVVSKLDTMEVDNAVLQTQREIGTRFDFRDTGTTLEKNAEGFVLVANSESRLEAAIDVLQGKLLRRGVSLKHLDPQKPVAAARGTFRQVIKLKEGIDRENARKVIELVKESKIKVQAAIHDDTVRITGKNRDDLQAAIRVVKGAELPIEMQCVNFRD